MVTGSAERPAAGPIGFGNSTGGGSRRRRLVTLLCWTLSTGWGLIALIRLIGWRIDWWPLMIEPAVVPYAALTAVVPLGMALIVRRWFAAALAAVTLVALVMIVVPRAFGGPDPVRGPAVRVMSANLREGHADPAALVDLVRGQRVDVLAIEEVTFAELDRLTSAGLAQLLPFSSANPTPGGPSGTALFSRYPLTDIGRQPLPYYFVETSATVQVPGAVPVLVNVIHYCAPVDPGQAGCWRAGVNSIPRATPKGAVRLLLGDLNMTVDYPQLRNILASGYRDAADVVGEGLTPTWPYLGPPLPKVTIDHVLADRRIGVTSVSIEPIENSDHRALVAQLSFPSA